MLFKITNSLTTTTALVKFYGICNTKHWRYSTFKKFETGNALFSFLQKQQASESCSCTTPTCCSYLLTAESVRMVAIGDLMFFRSHTLTVRSSLPDTTLSPTVKTADVTVLKKLTKTFTYTVVRKRRVTWLKCFSIDFWIWSVFLNVTCQHKHLVIYSNNFI